jgi:hypothetical protein
LSGSDAIRSMRKTALALAGAGVASGALAVAAGVTLDAAVGPLAAAALGALAVAAASFAAAGHLVVARQRLVEGGGGDRFLAANGARSEAALRAGPVRAGRLRRRIAARFDHRLVVGEAVRVKSWPAIRATLDASGGLEGLPFMDEMRPYCGRTLRVYRVLDKIYDYGRSRLMRRIDGCVLLLDTRCDGSAHDGCEADCYLVWKHAWLEAADDAALPTSAPPAPAASPEAPPAIDPARRYTCQYNSLTNASRPMAQRSLYALLGPWAAGNVTGRAFVVALATAAFNAVQAWRGGATYPDKPTPSDDKSLRGEPLRPGDWVRVKLPPELARAMDRNSKNRGLWFDKDMLKFAGGVYQVRRRVERIIDIHSGAMIAMKTPCIALEDVHLTGEFQCFGEQHDYLYWREAWLTLERRAEGAAGDDQAAARATAAPPK